MKPKSPEDIVKGTTRLVTLPNVYMKLMELIRNPETSSRDFANVIQNDAGLSAIILKTANSAHFSLPSKVDTLPRAIALIGTKALSEIIVASNVVKTFRNIPQDLLNLDSFWHHSLACGVFAREIASACHKRETDSFFTSGLLHDVGRLVMFGKCPDEMREAIEMSREKGQLLFACERKILSFDHADVGGILMESWHMPTSLQEAIQYHHNPKRALGHPFEAAVVHLADIMANALQYGTSGEYLIPDMQPEAVKVLKLRDNQMKQIVKKSEESIAEMLRLVQ